MKSRIFFLGFFLSIVGVGIPHEERQQLIREDQTKLILSAGISSGAVVLLAPYVARKWWSGQYRTFAELSPDEKERRLREQEFFLSQVQVTTGALYHCHNQLKHLGAYYVRHHKRIDGTALGLSVSSFAGTVGLSLLKYERLPNQLEKLQQQEEIRRIIRALLDEREEERRQYDVDARNP